MQLLLSKYLTYRPPLLGGAYFCRVGSSCCGWKKEQKNVGEVCWTKLEIGRRVGLLGSEKVEGETPATGWHSDHLGPDHICHSVAFWSYWSWSWSWSYLPQCGILNTDQLGQDHICHQVAFSILIILVTIKSATRWQTNHLDLGKPWSKYIFFLILDLLEMIFQFDTFITILVIWENVILWLWWLKLQTWMTIVLNAE